MGAEIHRETVAVASGPATRREREERSMSAFGGKADMPFALHMSAFDPKRRLAGCLATCSSARCHPLTSPFRALVYPQSF
jgi:hypothetical protein